MFGILSFIGAATAAQATETVTLASQPEKMVCKRIEEDSTGFRLGRTKRVCRTKTEWRALDKETARALNKAKSQGLLDPDSKPKSR